jgi:carbamoyl-phosphate synthase large subunit
MVRPSYVLGGRSMQIVYDQAELLKYMESAVQASAKHPVLIDKYLDDAIEVDADAVSDGEHVVVAGVMEHIEEAGVHSGDSACSLPPYTLPATVIAEIERQMKALALELGVVGLMNAQFAVKGETVFVLEVNPRASRTVPFVSKAIGAPLAKLAMRVMLGQKLKDLGFTDVRRPAYVSVKEAVFPFNKFAGVDVLLGPEMKSTGEVMGIDADFGWAYAKAQAAAGSLLPRQGKAFISVKKQDRQLVVEVAKRLHLLGFELEATSGTADFLRARGLRVDTVNKVHEGRPHIVDHMKNGEISFVVNTVATGAGKADSLSIRREALHRGIPYYTTMRGALAAVMGIEAALRRPLTICSLQEHHQGA